MALPNFVIIGAKKAATTAMWAYLRQHPQVFMSEEKEARYFLVGEKLIEHLPLVAPTLESYEALFAAANGELALGEATPDYLPYPNVATKISGALPGAKIIAILRDPTERAFSHFLMRRRAGAEPRAEFADVVHEEIDAGAHGTEPIFPHLGRGLYFGQLQPYLGTFGAERVHICLDEDLAHAGRQTMRAVHEFLGVDQEFAPTMETVNIGGKPRSEALWAAMNQPNLAKSIAKAIVPRAALARIKQRVRDKNLKKPEIDADVRKQCIAFHREQTEQLQTLLGRDLSHWLN